MNALLYLYNVIKNVKIVFLICLVSLMFVFSWQIILIIPDYWQRLPYSKTHYSVECLNIPKKSLIIFQEKAVYSSAYLVLYLKVMSNGFYFVGLSHSKTFHGIVVKKIKQKLAMSPKNIFFLIHME